MAFSLLVWFAIWEVVGRLDLVSLLPPFTEVLAAFPEVVVADGVRLEQVRFIRFEDERVFIRDAVIVGAGRAVGDHGDRLDDPLTDVVSRELSSNPVERARLSALAGDGVAHRAFLGGVHLRVELAHELVVLDDLAGVRGDHHLVEDRA